MSRKIHDAVFNAMIKDNSTFKMLTISSFMREMASSCAYEIQ